MTVEPEEPGDPLPGGARYGILGPVVGSATVEMLRKCPPTISRQALEAVAALAAGDAAAWASVKRLKLSHLLSYRVGLAHRLLFRVATQTNMLMVEHFIHRRDLEQTLKQYI